MRTHRYSVHGLAVEISCAVTELIEPLRHLLAPFEVSGWPDGFNPTTGTIDYFDQAQVLRHLSPRATAVPDHRELLELYQDGERFWVIDEQWGMAEINLLKNQWRAWVLPGRRAHDTRCLDSALLWPMAQLLRPRQLHLVPAVAVARETTGFLIICPFSLERELAALIGAGYRIIGQRWAALRDEDGQLSLLRVPGRIERSLTPQLRAVGVEVSDGWVDLDAEHPFATRYHAQLRAVLIVDPARRVAAELRELSQREAASALRRTWPIVELHPRRRPSLLLSQVAQRCYVGELELSRKPQDLISLLSFIRPASTSATMTTVQAA